MHYTWGERSPLLLGLALLTACKPPPAAPEELDPLVAFLFEHHLDEDPEGMVLGLEALRSWFDVDFDADANASFELLTPLSQESVESLNGSVAWTHPNTKAERTFLEMGGAAAGTVSLNSLDAAVAALGDPAANDEPTTRTHMHDQREHEG